MLTAIREGAVLRVLPEAMTAAVVLADLLPFCSGTDSEVMTRIVAPVIGGMMTALVLSMLGRPLGI